MVAVSVAGTNTRVEVGVGGGGMIDCIFEGDSVLVGIGVWVADGTHAAMAIISIIAGHVTSLLGVFTRCSPMGNVL